MKRKLSEEHKEKIKLGMKRRDAGERISKAAKERWSNPLFKSTMVEIFNTRSRKQFRKRLEKLQKEREELENESEEDRTFF